MQNQEQDIGKTKICHKCRISKKLSEFCNDKLSKDGKHYICKVCRKNYNSLNKEEINLYNKNKYDSKKYREYYLKNIEKKTKYCSEYREKNKKPKKIREKKFNKKEYALNYCKNKYKNDIQYKLGIILRSRFYHLLRKNKSKKISGFLKILDCNIDECKQYLEQQFLPEFNWDNYGKIWEIDHIIGCINFDLIDPEQQRKCFHYTNLRPIFKTTEIAISFGYIDQVGNRNKVKRI